MAESKSPRWKGHELRPLVEDSRRVDFNTPSWRAILEGFALASGQLVWTDSSGEPTGTVEFELGPIEENRERILTLTDQGSDPVSVNLKETRVGIDQRWHAECPLDCDRRVRTLFLAEDGGLGCRSCLNLVYRSSRESDGRVSLCRRDPDEFIRGRSHRSTVRSQLVTAAVYLESKRRGFRVAAGSPTE